MLVRILWSYYTCELFVGSRNLEAEENGLAEDLEGLRRQGIQVPNIGMIITWFKDNNGHVLEPISKNQSTRANRK